MQISIEGKLGILLGLLALGGGGAVWVAPDHTEIGWLMIATAGTGTLRWTPIVRQPEPFSKV